MFIVTIWLHLSICIITPMDHVTCDIHINSFTKNQQWGGISLKASWMELPVHNHTSLFHSCIFFMNSYVWSVTYGPSQIIPSHWMERNCSVLRLRFISIDFIVTFSDPISMGLLIILFFDIWKYYLTSTRIPHTVTTETPLVQGLYGYHPVFHMTFSW